MAIKLPLESMSVSEKLDLMEQIWESLSADPESIESPAWHGEVLAQREDAITRGDDGFESWEDALEHIRKKTR